MAGMAQEVGVGGGGDLQFSLDSKTPDIYYRSAVALWSVRQEVKGECYGGPGKNCSRGIRFYGIMK